MEKVEVSEHYLALEAKANTAGLYITRRGRQYKFFTKPTVFTKPALHKSMGFDNADNFVVGWVFGRDFEVKFGKSD